MADCTPQYEPSGAETGAVSDTGSVGQTRPALDYYGKGRALARTIDLAEIRAAYEGGLSTVDLEQHYGVSRRTIRLLLRKAGCRLRTVQQASRVRPAASWLRLDKPLPPARRYTVIDVFGCAWSVTREALTRHGFDVLRGVREGRPSTPAIILTAELARHLEAHRASPRDAELPVSPAGITRLRRQLGHDWLGEIEAWWLARSEELARLSVPEFAVRYGVSVGSAARARRRYCGITAAKHDWRDPALRALVLSPACAEELAVKLRVSVGHVKNLRCRLRKEEGASR